MLLATAPQSTEAWPHTLSILVLCTGNSARSVMAEGLFNYLGHGRFQAYSAGSRPTGRVNPFAQEQLNRLGADLPAPSSKSWNEFTGRVAPDLDIVVTVCGNAAGESCPQFNGLCERVHWGLPDPAAVSGTEEEIRAAFAECFEELERRIRALLLRISTDATPAQVAHTMRAMVGEAGA